ncbi:MAG: GEVED domain-containing protein, partial [Saprospiraceae bacterium]
MLRSYPTPKSRISVPNWNISTPIQPAVSRSGFLRELRYLLLILATLMFAINVTEAQVQELAAEKAKMDERVRSTLKENAQTIHFLENKGQIDNKDVLYYFESREGSVYIERDRLRFVAVKDTLVDEEHDDKGLQQDSEIEDDEHREMTRLVQGTHTFSLYIDGANIARTIKLGDSFATNYNYYLGTDQKNWATKVKAAKDLTLEDVYPGIDLRLYSNSDGTMEFDWIFDAGADYTKVKLRFEGQDALSVDAQGSLDVGLKFTDVKFHIPQSYQVTENGKIPVSFSFNKSNENTIGFATQSVIDPRFPMVIDPTLSWGTFFDGNNTGFDDYLFAVQVDPADGIVYCAGGTNRQIPTGAAPYDANGYLNVVTGLNGGADALPHVAVVYRINSSGNDLLDVTLFGPSTVTGTDNTLAHGLSLSTNNVFIGGVTTSAIPTTGSPFDGTRDSGDGFVAIFTKDLGTLNYATYLGGSGNEVLGVTSIRALSDNSFVAGLTVNAALPAGPAAPDYIIGSPADATFAGASEMYIAKFTTNNVLSWGTYIGGANDEVFNDLEVFADGRVTFAGYGNGTLTEFNPVVAATSSVATNNTDGIIGVLNSTGTTINYLDKIGANGNGLNDRINDVEIVGDTLYWTGSASAGFPVSASGVYDNSQNGSTDVIVGKVYSGGVTGYKSTYYGSTSADLGNGIRLVTSTSCAGVTTTFLMIFGTVGGSGLPTQNFNSEPFFNATYQGGLDMFFAGFNSSLTTLTYGTYMGGVNDDYLGSTGDPRGANHLWVNNVNVYLGTTTHNISHVPTLVAGGFDLVNQTSASGEDCHIVISIQFPSFIESDYSDAPATYGNPSHTLDCTHLKIGTLLDAESAAAPTTLANGDDIAGSDDEDGISTLPSFSDGGPQNISVTVINISNTTGATANLYGWIDLNSNGQFEAGEFTSTTVATGFSGSKVLTWTGVTVSGTAANHYLRIRLTTNTLNDNGGTAAVDERSTTSASNGEVEDYRAVDLTCPTVTTSASCLTQAQINTAYGAWLTTAKAGGGCNDGTLTNNSAGAPTACVGGTSTVTFTYTSACAPLTTTCMSSFTVPVDASPVITTCAVTRTVEGCNTGAITTPVFSATTVASTEAVFESAPNNGNTSDNCAITSVTYSDIATGTCPIVVTRRWTVTDVCGHTATCNQTINVTDTTPPTASNPAPTSVQCIAGVPAPDPLVVINEADNCSTPTVTLLSNTNNGGAGCAASPYIATRIY